VKRNLLFSLAIFSVAFGVEHLSIEDVFRATLEHNHSLILSRHSEESAQRSAEFLNSGLLPTAGISAGLTYTNGSSGVDKTTSSAGLQVSYTLFDGFYTINSYRLNREKAELSAIQTKALADLTLLQSATAYLAVQSAEQSLKIAQKNSELSAQRHALVSKRVEFGQGSSLDQLSAAVDLRSDSSTFLQAMTSVRTAKSNLNLLMGRSSTADYTVDDSIMLHEIPLLPEILANAQKRSSELLAAESQSVMAKFQQSMARSAFLPKVTVGAEYGVSNSYNGFAIPTEKDPAGMFTGSLRLNWAIFDGRARSTYRNSTSAVSDSEIKAESERLAIEAQVRRLYDSWETSRQIVATEKQTVELAKEVLRKSVEQFARGQIQSLTLRESQLMVVRSELALVQAMVSQKTAECTLRRLNGSM